MTLTIADIDIKIEQAQARVDEAKEDLAYWQKFREFVDNPRFAELSPSSGPVPFHLASAAAPSWQPHASSEYGKLKRLTFECLPTNTPVTPQQLAKLVADTGFQFKTKTPAISINDTLHTLQKEQKAIYVGKSPTGNAGMWLRKTENEKEVPEGTS